MKGPVPTAVRRKSGISRGTMDDQFPAMPARRDALGCLVVMRTVCLSTTSICSMAER